MADQSFPWPPGSGAVAARIRRHDWAATPLGPLACWPVELRTAVMLVLDSVVPALLVWGDALTMLPNDGFLALPGGADALGRSAAGCRMPGWARIEPALRRARCGDAARIADVALTVADGHAAVFTVACSPVRLLDGTTGGAIAIATESGRRDAAHEGDARFRAFVTASADAVYRMSADWSEMSQLDGKTFLDDSVQPAGDWLDRYIEPQDRAMVRAAVDRAIRERSVFDLAHRVRRRDGSVGWTRSRAVPILDDAGRIVEWLGTASDITDARLAFEAQAGAAAAIRESAISRASEERLQTLVEGVPQLVWRAADGGRWTWASRQWTDLTGQSDADSHDHGWRDAIHPDDRGAVDEIWRQAAARGEFEADHRVCDRRDGGYRWFQSRATPVRDADGRIVEWLGTSTDVDDLRGLQKRQEVLVAELQHRVRNILTVVRSVFSRTVETGDDIAEIADHFKGRLDALARTQVIVTRSAERTVDLEDLVREELLSVAVNDGPAVTIAGDEVKLPWKVAETLGLALHELTTNSLKYGALKISGGRLAISWKTKTGYGGDRVLHLTWQERGVPAIDIRPVREGFGRELIEEALPYRLGAETKLEFGGGGVRCSIAIPLRAGDETEGIGVGISL